MNPTLVFDYDGTIHNTIVIYERAFRHCYQWLVSQKYVEEKEITTDKISNWLGMNSHDMWDSFQPGLDTDIKEKASNIIGENMIKQILENQAVWYQDVEKVLDELLAEGYSMVVLSNCKTAYKEVNWNKFSMDKWFSKFYDCQSFGFAPKTEIIHTVQKENPGKMIVIGDRKSDLDCARVCDAFFVGCLYGFGKVNELTGSDRLIHSLKELPDIIQSFKNF